MKYIKLVISIMYVVIVFEIKVCFTVGPMINGVLFLPLSFFLVLVMHELMHLVFFLFFGCSLKRMRIGLIEVLFDKKRFHIKIRDKGMFYGYCTINECEKVCNWKLIFSLMAGGMSGAIIGTVSIIALIANACSVEYVGMLDSIVIAGFYSFVVTLLVPNSGDRLQIRRIKGADS